jgi:hypothetical protein
MKSFKSRARRQRRRPTMFKKLITGFTIICLSYLVLQTFTGCEKATKDNYQSTENKENE